MYNCLVGERTYLIYKLSFAFCQMKYIRGVIRMTREELEEKYGDILNDWSEELRIEQDEKMIYYTKEQKQKLFINLEEQGYTKEELTELDEYMKVHIYTKEEYFANCKPFEFRGGTEWETMEEWFEDVEYQFEEVA